MLAGCAESGSSSQADSSAAESAVQTATESVVTDPSEVSEPNDWENYEKPIPVSELKSEKYPDKPHLRVMLAKNRGYRLELLHAFNEKLDERGLDFAIDLVMIDEMEKHPMTYCRECFEGGTVPDIIMTGTGVPEEVAASAFPDGYEPHENTYWECVKNGWLEPLDSYPSQGDGAKLKEIRKASEANRGAQKKIREASKKQAELMKAAKIDEAAVMAAIDEVFEARKAMAKAQTKRIIAVKSILTPEQIEKFYGEIVKEQKERGARRTGQRPCAQKRDSDGKPCPNPEAE